MARLTTGGGHQACRVEGESISMNSRIVRRAGALAASVALAGSLAACGSQNATPAQDPSSTTSTSSPSESTSASEAGTPAENLLSAFKDAYGKNHGVTVSLKATDKEGPQELTIAVDGRDEHPRARLTGLKEGGEILFADNQLYMKSPDKPKYQHLDPGMGQLLLGMMGIPVGDATDAESTAGPTHTGMPGLDLSSLTDALTVTEAPRTGGTEQGTVYTVTIDPATAKEHLGSASAPVPSRTAEEPTSLEVVCDAEGVPTSVRGASPDGAESLDATFDWDTPVEITVPSPDQVEEAPGFDEMTEPPAATA